MNKYSVEEYALAVCFFCVFGLVLNIGEAAYALVEINAPAFTMSKGDIEYRATVTSDTYWKWLSSTDKQLSRPSEEQLAQRRSAARDELLLAHADSGKGTLSKSLIYIVLLAGVLLGHWRLAAKFRRSPPPSH